MAETKTTQPKSASRSTTSRSRGAAAKRSTAATRSTGAKRTPAAKRSTAAKRSGAASSSASRRGTASSRSTSAAATSRSNTTTRRKAGATKRSTVGKKAAETRAERAAAANARRIGNSVQNRVERVQNLAERAVHIQLGAALEARDRVAGAVGEVTSVSTSRKAAERQLKRFERRGGTARNRVERELRQRRTRIERTLKRNERDLRAAQRDLEKDGRSVRNTVAANVDLASARVEHVVQTGVTEATKLVAEATERVASTVS